MSSIQTRAVIAKVVVGSSPTDTYDSDILIRLKNF